MLVFGDRVAAVSPRVLLAQIAAELCAEGPGPAPAAARARVEASPARVSVGYVRHARLVDALIDAGMLAQGLADLAFAAAGRDELPRAGDPRRLAMALAMALARAVWWSYRRLKAPPAGESRACLPGDADAIGAAVTRLSSLRLPEIVEARVPEGYAHYALYPEAYAEAAGQLANGDGRPLLVIGVRSIGTSLGAMVAAGAGSRAVALTVRPVGHPFARRLALSERLARLLRRTAGRVACAVVDEGPGLSGSSFGSVAEALAGVGTPDRDICYFPSHLGDLGPQAGEARRNWWGRAARRCVQLEPPDLLAAAAEVLGARAGGALQSPPEDIGGGRWRTAFHGAREDDWPPARVDQERRKFLLRAGGRRYLARFVGLGRFGQARCARAETLGEEGWCPPIVGLAHGFLLQPWVEGARPYAPGLIERGRLIAKVADYIAFRAARFRAAPGEGATPGELLEMAAVNAGEELGDAAADKLRRFEGALPALTAAARPIAVDARLHAWEWLVTPAGALVKTDALDHCDGHDLVGCQDVAWDVVGAAIELDLDPRERAALARAVRTAGAQLVSDVLPFYELAYLAFQLGRSRMGAQALAAAVPTEARRLDAAARRYAATLTAVLARPGGNAER